MENKRMTVKIIHAQMIDENNVHAKAIVHCLDIQVEVTIIMDERLLLGTASHKYDTNCGHSSTTVKKAVKQALYDNKAIIQNDIAFLLSAEEEITI